MYLLSHFKVQLSAGEDVVEMEESTPRSDFSFGRFFFDVWRVGKTVCWILNLVLRQKEKHQQDLKQGSQCTGTKTATSYPVGSFPKIIGKFPV